MSSIYLILLINSIILNETTMTEKIDPKEKKAIEIKKPPVLFEKSQQLIRAFKAKCDGDFMTYWISSNSAISDEDTIAFYEVLNSKQSDTLNLFIKSDGGSGEGSLRIVNLLRQYYKTIIAYVPLDCASAATMLALGADEIKMGPLSYLSAIDTSITHDLSPVDEKYNDKVSVSQNELSRVLHLWKKNESQNDVNPYAHLYKYIHPLVFGSVDRATSLSIQLTSQILSYHMEDEAEVNRVSNHLNSDYPSHSYPITYDKAKQIGLKVAPLALPINNILLKLNEIYSEMAQLAYTDFDEINYHDNEILKFVEGVDMQLFFQKDKDWHYRSEERRWVSMNDNSSWRRNIYKNNILEQSQYFVR